MILPKKSAFLEDGARTGYEPRVTIIPAPLSNTVSWVDGTDKGPAEVLAASDTLELFDDELLVDTWRLGIETTAMPDYSGLSSSAACADIFTTVAGALAKGRLPVVIGGEHTVALSAIAACCRYYADLTVVQIDAHLDLRDSYGGDELSHACVMRRVDDLAVPFIQVGGRSLAREEHELLAARKWQPIYMRDIWADSDWLEKICNKLTGPVYITFDCDALDPSIMPATGTPEPGGLDWWQVTQLFKRLAADYQIVGLDFVEFAPIPGGHHAAYTMAKLIYRTLGYIFHKELRRAEEDDSNRV